MMGHRFKAQHPIDIFIADFYCHKLKLIIEVDGGIHKTIEQKEYDLGRTQELERFGLKVIRFTNHQIENELRKGIIEIANICKNRQLELHPQSPLEGI